MPKILSEGLMKTFLVGLLLWSAVSLHAQAAGSPQKSAEGHRASSSSVDAGDYVYISAQGPRGGDGELPATFAAQVRQALNNLKAVVESAGLTMDHVVYTTVYLTDIHQYEEMNRVYGEFFGKTPPARAVLGVAALPDPAIAINAVAVRNLAERRAVSPPGYKSDEPFSPGILTRDRLFVSALPAIASAGDKASDDPAAEVDFALDRMKAVVEAAGLDLGHMVFVNPYLTANFPARVMNQHYASRSRSRACPAELRSSTRALRFAT
jgi:reactive intermediate/imine deaminase